MNGEKPEPKTWEEVKKDAENGITIAKMNLAIHEAVLMAANTQLQKK